MESSATSTGMVLAPHPQRNDDYREEVEAPQGTRHARGSNPGHAMESCSAVANNARHVTTVNSTQRTSQRAGRALWQPLGAWLLKGCDSSHSGHHHVLWRVRENASWTVPTREERDREGVWSAESKVGQVRRFKVKRLTPSRFLAGIIIGAPPQ